MDYQSENKGTYTLYKLSGRLLGEYDGNLIRRAIAQQIEAGDKYFVLDLSQLEYMNSSGVGLLVTLLTKARNADGELVLLSPSKNVSTVLTMMRLQTIFKIFEAEEAAVVVFSTGG